MNENIPDNVSVARFHDEPSPIPFLIDRCIPSGTCGAIYSEGGVGKSTLAYGLMVQLALGDHPENNWLGTYPITEKKKSLLVSAEDPDIVLHHRHHGIRSEIAQRLSMHQDKLDQLLIYSIGVLNMVGTGGPLVQYSGNKVHTTPLFAQVEEVVSKMKPERKFSGLGGLIEAKPIPSIISFKTAEGGLVEEKGEVYIATGTCPHPKLKLLPSILGRDIINRYTLTYSPSDGKVYLKR